MNEKVTWHYTFPHGYNHVIPVDAIVVKRNPSTVRIAVWSYLDNCIKFRNVAPEKLTARTKESDVDAGYAAYCAKQIPARMAHTILANASERKRRVYSICKLDQADGRGLCYHGFVNVTYHGEACFATVGATSLDSGTWYDLNLVGLKKLIAERESEVSHE